MTQSLFKLSRIIGLGVALALTGAGGTASAAESTSAMAAPKCDMEKIKKLCSESKDCVKVEKGAWEGGYNVTSKDKDAETRFMTEVVIKNCM